jgi:hypothetical protein
MAADITNREDPVAQRKGDAERDRLHAAIVKHARAAGAKGLKQHEVIIDCPEPPGLSRLGDKTLIEMVRGYVVKLADLFPFQKVVNNYSRQYKYRSYVFAPPQWASEVAYAAFRTLTENGMRVNDLSLILANQAEGRARELLAENGIAVPDWQREYYLPDAAALAE